MNNDLEQFSEERLKDMQKHVTAGMTLGHADALLIRQALDVALSAKQDKAIGYVESKTTGTDRFILKGFYEQDINIGDRLYTTPHPAHTEQVIPDGWKLVPIEPTHEMKLQVHPIAVGTCHNCGCEVNPDCEDNVLLSWQDMLAAAPVVVY
ncbi:hypothetical protein [Rahnella sp. ChDrAdgB13]|uniref:hypothetical protein n=1 Tax=Rahnella sp. ChDrAdgB13 TaxID=1850581 RepID=UPI001AD89330|nr:hypothetical protein [Rahnella sp. ChDrAdgB13]